MIKSEFRGRIWGIKKERVKFLLYGQFVVLFLPACNVPADVKKRPLEKEIDNQSRF